VFIIEILLLVVTIYLALRFITILGEKSILLLYMIIHFAQMIMSQFYLNAGNYAYELGKITYYVLESTVLFLFYIDVFLCFLIFFARRVSYKSIAKIEPVKRDDMDSVICRWTIWLVLVLMLYVSLDIVVSGIPLFVSSITRYNYWSSYSTLPFASTVNNWISVGMFLLGYAYVHINKKSFRVICILEVVFVVALRMLMDQKMSGVVDTVLNFIAIAVLSSDNRLSKIRNLINLKYIIIALCIAATAIGIYVFNVTYNGKADSLVMAIELLQERAFGLGNHLWWAAEADNRTGNSLLGRNTLQEVLSVLELRDINDLKAGLYYLMLQYGVGYIVQADINGGVRFGATFLNTSIYYFGYIFAILIIAFVALLVVKFVYMLNYCVKTNRVFPFILLCKIWGTFATYVYASGALTEWINVENFIYFLLFYYLLTRRKRYIIKLKSCRKG